MTKYLLRALRARNKRSEARKIVQSNANKETYIYNNSGLLYKVFVAQGSAPSGQGAERASYIYDKMGRVTRQIDYHTTPAAANPSEFRAFDKQITYNAKGQITTENTYTIRTQDTWTSETTFNYGSGSNYKLGSVVFTTGRTRKNQFSWVNTRTDNLYEYHGGASLKKITIKPDTSQSETRTTDFTLDNIGTVISAAISDGRARTVSYINDHAGQVIERKEQSGATNEPRELRYRFGGKEMGFTSNNGTLNTDYHTSIADRTITPADNNTPGAFRHGTTYGTQHAEFDNSYAAIAVGHFAVYLRQKLQPAHKIT